MQKNMLRTLVHVPMDSSLSIRHQFAIEIQVQSSSIFHRFENQRGKERRIDVEKKTSIRRR